jgi:hypothetical protein
MKKADNQEHLRAKVVVIRFEGKKCVLRNWLIVFSLMLNVLAQDFQWRPG